uniref:UBA domain-containing protein n=1 Tax=Noctiluca scintillans TaxID=2966 RepID=A0A7S1FG62_NOCSC|mmetsp:Transcript_61860/g.164422  ORF Transcript_61860/g.164422 Transcript_61860/m.164422 type:complete len:193 (+) Transcript_61860:24-602(+)
MVRRAIEASMDDLVIRINGDVANALEKALEQSKALEATERRQREVESRDLAKAREMSRLEAGILDSDSEDEGARCARPSVGVVRRHPVAVEELVDMGFAPEAAARALRDAAGDVATAAVMLTGPPTKRPRHEKEPVDLGVQSAPRQTLGSLPESIMSLIEMGFNEAVAVQALSDAGGDLSVAAAMLLSTAKA